MSCTAGSAGCNHAFHGLIHLPATDFPGPGGGFVHVPFVPGQAADARPSLPVEQPATALNALFVVALSVREDFTAHAGR